LGKQNRSSEAFLSCYPPTGRLAITTSRQARQTGVWPAFSFLPVVPEPYRALIVFAVAMGLRQGECFGLTVDRVDFLRRHVRVDRSASPNS